VDKASSLLGLGKVDISVVEIRRQRHAYSRLKPKVHPTEVALSAKNIVGGENCDKTGKRNDAFRRA